MFLSKDINILVPYHLILSGRCFSIFLSIKNKRNTHKGPTTEEKATNSITDWFKEEIKKDIRTACQPKEE